MRRLVCFDHGRITARIRSRILALAADDTVGAERRRRSSFRPGWQIDRDGPRWREFSRRFRSAGGTRGGFATRACRPVRQWIAWCPLDAERGPGCDVGARDARARRRRVENVRHDQRGEDADAHKHDNSRQGEAAMRCFCVGNDFMANLCAIGRRGKALNDIVACCAMSDS